MTIANAQERCKVFVSKIPRDAVIVGVLVLASSASFGLGYLTGLDTRQGSSITIKATPLADSFATSTSGTGKIVASKNGTKYYPSTCAGANRISESNKVWFASAQAAETAGYTLAANCK
jgi:hypothetical protein